MNPSTLARLGTRLTTWTERWVPDAWVIAVLLTLVVAAMAILGAGAAPWVGLDPAPICEKTRTCGAFDAWSTGLWQLLPLMAQFALALVAAYACAASRPMYWLMDRLAGLPSSPRRAILLMGVFSLGTAYVNWAVNLVLCALFVPILAARQRQVDARLLVATAYVGIGTIWHGGLSGSAPLIAATPGNFLVERGLLAEPLPISETLLSPFNLLYLLVVGAVVVAVAVWLHPGAAETVSMDPEKARALVTPPAEPTAPAETWAERLDRSRSLTLLAAGLVLAHLALRFERQGAAAWDINGYNAAFLGLALALHDSPRSFLAACAKGAGNAWGVLVQFPLYAGIFGLMTLTPLAERLSDWVAGLATSASLPFVVYVLSAVINFFVPSGGSQWVLEAPYILEAGARHGVPAAVTTLAFCYGDMSTNLIQPFWAIPLLAVSGASFGGIMGYSLVLFAASFVVTSGAMWLVPFLG